LWNTTINSSGISGSKIVYLIDTGSNRVYDTITLLDTTDGVAGGSVIANSLITRRDPVANTYSPTSIPATASFFGTNGLEYSASFTVYPYFESNQDKLYYIVQSSASAILVQADDGNGNQFVSGSLANRLITKDINFKFTFTDPQTGDTSKINETFYIISDGADGDDAYTVVLTNDSHTLPTTNTGIVTYTNSGTSILAYRGTTELNGITTGVPTSGQFSASAITATNITPGTLTSPGNPLVVSDHNSMTSEIANISYTLNLEGTQSFTKIQTFSKARQGGDGFSNVSFAIVPISGTILKNKSGTLELQIARLSGSRYDYISGGTVVLVTGSANTTIAAGNGISAGTNGVSYNAIFDSTKISGSLIVRARDTSANITYDTITLADITDGVAAGGINSTNGLILVRNPNNNNTYTPSTTQLTASFYDVNGKQYTSSLLVTPNFTTTDQLRYTTGISDSNMVLEVRDVLGNVMTNNTYANTIGLNVRYTFTDPVSKDIVDAIETVQIASDGAKGLVFFADASKTQFVFDPDDNNKPALLYDYTDIFLKRNFNSGSSTFRIISGSTMPPLTLINTTFVGEFTQSVYRLYTGTSAESATSWSYNTPSTTTRTGTYVFTQASFSSSVDISGVLKGSGSKNLDVTSNANQFFYKMTDRSLSPTGQTITMLAKRNNLGNSNAIITVTSGSGLPPLTVESTTNGVTSYSISGTNYAFLSGSTTYTFTAPDLNASTYTDTITITPVLLPSQINVIASNENATLPANGYGFVASSSFVATSGSLSVKVGSDSILYASPLVSNSFSASISASFGVTGANVVSPGTYSITRLDADSGSLLLKVSYADGIGSQSIFTKDITYTKAKNAVPTTIVLLSSETQTVLSSSTIAAPSTFTVSANEGGSNYTYDAALSVVNTFYISSITGGTNASAVVTPTTPTTDSGTTVALTISYKNSIGGTGTINKNHIVSVSKKGDIGTTGNTGADGRRTATGMIHYQLSSGTIPTTPSATTYTFSSNTFASLTANWGVGAPIFSGSNSSKYWYSTYTAVETTAGGGTAAPTFSTPSQAIGFTGLVTFTSTDKITDGTNTTNIASTSSVTNHIGGPNVTTINGGKISTGTITSTQYGFLGGDTLTSGTFMADGTIFNLDNSGSIRSKNFYIDSLGNAVLRGSITILSGNAATTTALSSSLTTANNLAFSASVSASNAVTSGSSFASNAVTSGSSFASNAVTSGSLFATNAVTSGSNAATRAAASASISGAAALASAAASGSVDPASQRITKAATPGASSGLYLGNNNLGYYNGSNWTTYMDSSGNFYLGGTGGSLQWNAGTNALSISGKITVTDTTSNVATNSSLTSSLSSKYDASNPSGYQNNTSAKTGGSAGGWTIDGDSIFTGTKDTSGYSVTGITLFSGGSIHAPQFYIDTSGNAFFKGDITGASGTFSGTVTVGGTTLTTANTLNSNITSGNVTGALGYIPPTAANVTSSISQITIGGRNLLLNSQPVVYNQIVGVEANSSTITVDTTRTWKGQPTLRVDGTGGFRFLNNPIIEPYTEYIASMMVKADSSFAGSQTYPLHIQVPAGGHSHEVLGDYDQTVTTDWKQIWLKFSSNQTTNTTFQLYLYNIGTTLFNVAWAKLEKGNKQTDWTPAPEDIASGSIGNVDILGAGVLNYNPDFSISTVDGKPAGALASFSSTDNSIISFLDSNRNALKLSSPSDTTIGVTMPAIKLNKDARYNITFRVKSNATQTNGFYFRMGEIDVELPQGYTNISIYTGATGVYSTGVREVYSGAGLTVVSGTTTEYGPLTTSYVTYEVTYVPTTTAKWASPLFLKYDDIPTSGELHIDRLTIQQDTSIKTQGSVGGWTINSSQIFSGTAGSDGAFNAGAGITLGGTGYISSKNFYIDSSGNAFFKGRLQVTYGAAGSGINVAPVGMRYNPRSVGAISSTNYDNVSINGYTIENAIDYATDPFGNKSLVWQCYPDVGGGDDTTSDAPDGGWNSNQFPIDNTKSYKFVIYLKRYTSLGAGAGNSYWGCYSNTVKNLSDSSVNGNPYFYQGTSGLQLNKWYLIVGYVYGKDFQPTSDDRGGVYDCDTGQKVAAAASFKWNSTATTTNHRAYLYYNTLGDTNVLYQEFFNPSVYEVDGTEPDLNRLLDKGKMVGNGSYSGGTFIDGRNFYAPNISGSTGDFTGKITATSGEIGGWIIDSDKLYSPPSGSNNVIKMKLEPNSINPQFTLSDGTGAPAVVIKTGQLLDAAAGAANITVAWNADKSGFTAGTTTGDLFETKYNTAEAFTVSATGLYTGTITLTARNAFTPLASGYYRYEVGAIITDDAGIGNILYQSSISLIDSFSQIGVQKVFPARTKTVEVTFNSTGTYYIVSYWQRLVTGDEPSATFNTVSHDFPTFTLSKSTSYTELTDFGFQSIRSSTRFVKIQRVGSSDTMLNVGGDIEATGNITAYSSDMRLKTNVNILQNPLEKLSKLSGFTYNWNDKANELVGYDTNESIVGMFAQDVQEVLPEAVRIAPFDSDGEGNSKSGENYLTVQYEKVVPLLVEAIKELKNEIEELKTQINKK
jgi:hypothetical protein